MSKADESVPRHRTKSPVLWFITFLILGLSGPSHAHDDYPWVRNPKYLTATGAQIAHGDAQWIANEPKFSYCCGIDDCHVAADSEVVPIKDGWYLPSTGQTFREGDPDLHVSRDHRPWWCKPPSWNGWVKCLFVPGRGA